MSDPRGERGTVLITGATEGIGYELAKLFAADGHNLVLVARTAQRLQEIADMLAGEHGISVTTYPADLATPGSARELYNTLERDNIAIDMLVNNAGFGNFGRFHTNDPERERALLDLNITALTMLTRYLLPGMISRGHGRIMNVASTAAFQPGPVMATYYASKAYVLWFSEAIAHELSRTGVTVSALCPGPTSTRFFEHSGAAGAGVKRLKFMDTTRVAVIGYRGMMNGKRVIVPGMLNNLLVLSTRFAPRKFLAHVIHRFQGKQ